MTSFPARILIAPIRFYQRFITPYTPASCRYYPTCSAYAVTALRTHGAVVGTWLTIWRLLRCNPWSDGGIDHVPAKGQLRHRKSDAGAAHDHPDDAGPTADHLPPHQPGSDRPGSDAGEREDSVGSFPTADDAVYTAAAPDLDAPHSAVAEPMTGRSAA